MYRLLGDLNHREGFSYNLKDFWKTNKDCRFLIRSTLKSKF